MSVGRRATSKCNSKSGADTLNPRHSPTLDSIISPHPQSGDNVGLALPLEEISIRIS